ncbi:MAG: carboxypeptidase-like regulatory domain-containing protein [Gemmatimonadetes bacterium]|nr:carboxypeptidase-like regulatory domain-containing protein [Gemmatimonadota bacterium]MDE2678475.1 carboxypeptidase-like regulatory domain-containing protein [Gemmatimonadota bacterium]MXX34718.1 carboxypeptidase-like regulatory domain-containing protein [Gemmatimonadota bacterium]MYA10463.1 carboxypeptidase-like regulatory domain-containing protein [Gemmatimonadota bacterium]MYD11998.1 carboxypeptidase-like regulatory domain-containing protein [Gemmatimonadota bacterium]
MTFRNVFFTIVCVSAALAATRVASAQEVPTFTLTGKVVDRMTNAPVVAAVIKVPELERFVFTDGDGDFRFADFPQGTWEVVVEQFGYHTLDDSVTVSEGNGLFIPLAPNPIELDELRVRTRSERLLTRRRQRIPYRVVTIRTEAFTNAINTDPTFIFRRAANMAFVGCPGVVGEWIAQGCIARKGGVVNIRVYLDEGRMFGGMMELRSIDHESIHSMDWIPSAAMLRVYTKRFIDRLDNSRIALEPLVW